MCGIVGILERRGGDPAAHLAALRDVLTHRGPDDRGERVWRETGAGLGFRRLAILDPRPAGNQPMSGGSGTAWVVFNGEIYNFRQIRGELEARGHRFRTRTDTEVLAHGYEEWGVAVFERLRGMFACAFYEPAAHRLVLARDRFGIKPLYWFEDEQRFLFASEPKAILAHPEVPRRVSPRGVLDYLTYGYLPWDRSAFDGIHKLPPGHLMLVEEGRRELREYWQPEVEPSGLARGALEEELREELRRAVTEQMISDVPLGAFLSGGVDSSLVTALMSGASERPVRTVSIGFDRGGSELPYARLVAERYATDHVESVVRHDLALGLLDELSWVYDEPFADTSSVPTYHLCGRARDSVTVALSGDGGDELFAGYDWYGASLRRAGRPVPGGRLLHRLVNGLRGWPKMARLAKLLRPLEHDEVMRHLRFVGVFDPWELERLMGPVLRTAAREHDPLWLFRRFYRPDLPLLTALQLLDLRTFLVDDILVKVDRASMAHSLEVRPPLLDHRVAHLALSIPPHWQWSEGGGKHLLKSSVRDLLPAPILERGKRGFGAPVAQWFRGGLWSRLRRRILEGRCVRDGLLESSAVVQMVDNLTERRWFKVWALLALEHWYRRWIDGPRDEAVLRP